MADDRLKPRTGIDEIEETRLHPVVEASAGVLGCTAGAIFTFAFPIAGTVVGLGWLASKLAPKNAPKRIRKRGGF